MKFKKPKLGAKRIILHDRRITIPKYFRDFLKLKEGSVFEIRIKNKRLILRLIKR